MAKTILLADDSLTIQKVVELTFMDQDYQVTAVGDGQTALNHWAASRFDLVIADVHMPGANGYEVCRQVKASRPGTPVLLLVGTFETFDDAQAISCGANGHLKKPFDSQELFRLVDRLIAESARGSQSGAAPAPSAAELFATAPAAAAPAFSLNPTPSFDPAPPAFAAAPPAFAAPPVFAAAPPAFAAAPQAFDPAPVFAAAPAFAAAPPVFDPAPPAFEPAPAFAPAPSFDPAPFFAAPPEPAPAPIFSPPPVAAAPAPEPVFVAPPAAEPVRTPAAVADTRPTTARTADADAGTSAGSLSDADVERIARRVAELIADKAIKEIAWEVVPDLAEVVIKERIRELESQVQ